MTGAFSLRSSAAAAADLQSTAASFGFAFGSTPAATYIPAAGPTTTACAGSAAAPTATSGNVCVYEAASTNVSGTPCVFSTAAATITCNSASRFGFGIQVTPAAVGDVSLWGSWAATG